MPASIFRPFSVLVLSFLVLLPVRAQQALDLAALRAEQQALRPKIEAGRGRYATVPKPQRERLLVRQAELLVLLEGKQDAASLSHDDQLALRNAMDALVAAEKEADDSRLVCKRERTIGSHRSSTSCRTAAQIREQEETARRSVGETIGGCSSSSAGALCSGQ